MKKKTIRSYKNLQVLKNKAVASCKAKKVSKAELSELLALSPEDSKRAARRLSHRSSEYMNGILSGELKEKGDPFYMIFSALESGEHNQELDQRVSLSKDASNIRNSGGGEGSPQCHNE